MSGEDVLSNNHLLAAFFHFIPALVWLVLTFEYGQAYVRNRSSRLFLLIVLMSAFMAAHWLVHAIIELTPTQLQGRVPHLDETLYALIAVSQVVPAAIFRHIVPYMATREVPPTRTWLAVNYGSAFLVVLLAGLLFLLDSHVTGPWWTSPVVPVYAFVLVMVPLGIAETGRLRRKGALPAFYEVQDVAFWMTATVVPAVLCILVLGGLGEILLAPVAPTAARDPFEMSILVHTAAGLAVAGTFAVMILGEFLRTFVLVIAALGFGALALSLPGFAARIENPELRAMFVVLAIVGTILLLRPGMSLAEDLFDRLVFRQSRRSRERLQRFLQTLSPETGVLECCRRALDELRRVMQVEGAAIVLDRDEPRAISVGEYSTRALEAVWPTGEAARALPAHAFGFYGISDPNLREAVGPALTVPITSPRRLWGHMFLAEGLLGRATRGEHHVRGLEAFAERLGLVLDSAELLERAVAIERSLAHAERLAAIGELSARVAHEIRNPATAARSLAQQLAREPTPFSAELELILAELERIERQVSDLLRYARRDDFHFDRVDLAHLVRATAEELRARIEAAGVVIGIETDEQAAVSADGEKIRQVLLNLIENSLDALCDAPEPKQIVLHVARENGAVRVRVTDTGNGAPPEALARLFEPFFSLKEHGTGLGLAIARRTMEAHGGAISARSGAERGMVFEIELPPARTR